MLSSFDQLTEAIALAFPPNRWRDVHLLVAVSGGADSVALLRAIHRLKLDAAGQGKIYVAHFNHGLRGKASDGDQVFVEQLAAKLEISPLIGQPDAETVCLSEESARDARYQFFSQAAGQVGARYIATGHTADDQVETILLRMLRGAGLAGLRGIPAERPLTPATTIVRPLLAISRADLLAALAELGQTFREDGSNAQTHFTRNRVRLQLLPQLRANFGPAVDDALRRLSDQACEAQAVIECDAGRLLAAGFELGEASIAIDPGPLAAEPPLIVREAIKLAWRQIGWPEQAMGYQQWCQLAMLLNNPAAEPINLPGGVRAGWRKGRVVLGYLGGTER